MESIVGAWSVAVTTPNQGAFPALLTFSDRGTFRMTRIEVEPLI